MQRTLSDAEVSSLLKPQAKEDRLHPQPGSANYLALSDLRLAMDWMSTAEQGRLLDYGCGSSPYRSLFPKVDYLRADLPGMQQIDYEIAPGQPLDAASDSFDHVLSTQVLEHVEQPMAYLLECYRLLKPGGRLLLSTHGSFPDHGVPWDFQRWTTTGLIRDLRLAGFQVQGTRRITSGMRAIFQLWEMHMERAPTDSSVCGIGLKIVRKLTRSNRRRIHEWADACLAGHRLTEDDDLPEQRFYMGVAVIGIKSSAETAHSGRMPEPQR